MGERGAVGENGQTKADPDWIEHLIISSTLSMFSHDIFTFHAVRVGHGSSAVERGRARTFAKTLRRP